MDDPASGNVLPLRRIARADDGRAKDQARSPVIPDGDDDNPGPTAA
jgi:hypothetical protein